MKIFITGATGFIGKQVLGITYTPIKTALEEQIAALTNPGLKSGVS